MCKASKIYGCIAFLVIFLCPRGIFAADEITITTYHPSPAGQYKKLTTRSNTYLATDSGHVGIGTTSAGENLLISATWNLALPPGSQMTYGGEMAIIGDKPQIDFINTNYTDWAIHVNGGKMYFIRSPWNYQDLVLDGAGNVGIGTDYPAAKLHVAGTAQFDGAITGLSLDCLTIPNSLLINTAGFRTVSSSCPTGYTMVGCGDGSTFGGEHWGRWTQMDSNGCTAGVYKVAGTYYCLYVVYTRCCRVK
ncbi:MAG: hypothetical protein WC510_05485 [Candidatus Omnitrophota bacterium]